MSDRLFAGFAFLMAVAIVGGSAFVILTKGSGIVATESARPPQVPPALRPEQAYVPSLPQPAPSAGSGIYRCTERGAAAYSNRPCPNGREVDVRATSGFRPAPVPSRQAVYVEESSASEEPAPLTQAPSNKAACAAIEAAIASNDAAARAGGTAPYLDRLREDRHKLVDEKYRLKC
jgi:hypothetical protein